MSDPREGGKALPHERRYAYKPTSDSEREKIIQLRRLHMAVHSYAGDYLQGTLPKEEIPKYENAIGELKALVVETIVLKHGVLNSGLRDTEPGISLTQDGEFARLTVPSLSEHFGPIEIRMSLEGLGEDVRSLLPPPTPKE